MRIYFCGLLDNFDMTSTVPNLKVLTVNLPSNFRRPYHDQPQENFFVGTKEFRGEEVSVYTTEVLEDFQLPSTVIQHCRTRRIASVFKFSSCLTNVENKIQVIHDIEVHTEKQSNELILRLVGTLQEDSTRYHGILVSEFFSRQAGHYLGTPRRSLA